MHMHILYADIHLMLMMYSAVFLIEYSVLCAVLSGRMEPLSQPRQMHPNAACCLQPAQVTFMQTAKLACMLIIG